jgi:hypothetical protein
MTRCRVRPHYPQMPDMIFRTDPRQERAKCENRARSGEMLWSFRAVSRAGESDVGEFPPGANHMKVGCKLAIFGAVSRAAITASTVIDAIRIINSDTGQVAP